MHPSHLIAALVGLLGFLSDAAAAVRAQPDILLIMPDQFRGDCLSILKHSCVRTPNLDGLARQGALFRRAYTTCPSCIPARHSLLTGLFPGTSGVVGYAGRPISVPTFPQLLANAGYTTALVGRNMHQVPIENPYGYSIQILASTYVSNDPYDVALKRATGKDGGIRSLVEKLGLSNNGWAAKPWPLDNNLHPTAWIVGQARKVLKEAVEEKPLFLTASFFAPHPPLFPPKRFFDYYLEQKLPSPAHGQWVDWSALSTNGDKQGHRVLLEGDTLRSTQAGYFGLIEHLDQQIEPLITEFKKRSQRAKRPWLILFTADHGEMLGDHGFFRKCEPYEGSANIPFIVAASSALNFEKNLHPQAPVCLEDIMPTVLELAGANCPQIDGVSLVPLLRSGKGTVRELLHVEHAVCYSKEQAFHSLTDGHIKYIWRPEDGSEQLFNLEKDPREETDLSKGNSDQQLLKIWRQRMSKQLAGRPEGFSDGTTLIAGRAYPPLQSKSVR